ncbi:hypothetical protein [Endozoicomonas acroporae]|uniref:hypothetical protein n=1 Tax=Endozoicomonas acroporae TaxID=1701104 RepID=UPI003D792DDF
MDIRIHFWLEKINPATGGNLLHILFEADFFYCSDIDPNELVITVEWLNQNKEYKNLFLKLPAAVKVQEPDDEVSADA